MMAIFIDTVSHRNCKTCDRRDGHGEGDCYRIEAALPLIDVMAMVMDILTGLKLQYM